MQGKISELSSNRIKGMRVSLTGAEELMEASNFEGYAPRLAQIRCYSRHYAQYL